MDRTYGNLERAMAGKKYLFSKRDKYPIPFMARLNKIIFSASTNQTLEITAKNAANIFLGYEDDEF